MHPLLTVKFDPRAVSVSMTAKTLTVHLADGRAISQPLAWTPKLVTANDAQRANYKLLGGGAAIVWDDVDEDVYIGLMLNPRIDL